MSWCVGFQENVGRWMIATFGAAVAGDHVERGHRFVEEAIELAQANGVTKEDVLRLVDYVYSRPVGELRQEIGAVLITLAALCNAHGLFMEGPAGEEIERVWRNSAAIREKWLKKVAGSPLPSDEGHTQGRETREQGMLLNAMRLSDAVLNRVAELKVRLGVFGDVVVAHMASRQEIAIHARVAFMACHSAGEGASDEEILRKLEMCATAVEEAVKGAAQQLGGVDWDKVKAALDTGPGALPKGQAPAPVQSAQTEPGWRGYLSTLSPADKERILTKLLEREIDFMHGSDVRFWDGKDGGSIGFHWDSSGEPL